MVTRLANICQYLCPLEISLFLFIFFELCIAKLSENLQNAHPKSEKYLFSFSGLEPWSFEQHLGQAVFIPAGCPFQARNLQVYKELLVSLMVVNLQFLKVTPDC